MLPLSGLVFFGMLAALDERQAALTAGELGQEAELVELLSSTAVQVDVEIEAIAAFQQATTLKIDMSALATAMGFDALDAFDDGAQLDALLDEIAATPPELWASNEAIVRLQELRPEFEEIRAAPEVDSPMFDSVRIEMSAAITDALVAQTARLNAVVGRMELDHELAATALAREPSLSLMAAAREERRALADYLLPINDRTDAENYRDLVTAATHFDFVLGELRADLPETDLQRLDAALSTDAGVAYSALLEEAIVGEAEPAGPGASALSLIPHGLVAFANGFERLETLSTFDRQLSAEFTTAALELEASAEHRFQLAIIAGVALSSLAVVASLVTIRSITRPVWALLRRARSITEGDLGTHSPPSGLHDVGLVHQALDEMSANLTTLTEQAEALSDGRLDDAVLTQNVAGPLGASVHGSVARLRSMTARLEYEATHDPLTHLPNRSAVMSLLDRCLTGAEADRQPVAAVMLDLDGFKQANDDMGHVVGDEVLGHVARRLESTADGQFVARLGGDEFMIVVVGDDCEARATRLAAASAASIKAPMSVSSGTIELSASAGMVTTAGPAWLSPTEVLRRVDIAMYEAKSGDGEVVEFDQDLHDSILETTRLQGEIRRALDLEQFRLVLQPIVAVDGCEIVGHEALIRWTSPTRGEVSPGLFIPIAEQSDLIERIDNWVLRQAAAILSEWGRDEDLRHLTMSVNISARHLSNSELVAIVAEVIERHQLRADRLLIEVTESQLIPNLTRAENTLRGLRALGVRLAIDDFGTGYASVAHLRRVTFDRLKIDRSFLAHIDEETDRSLATLLVSLGRDLGMEVVAEGIETEAQLTWAVQAGCTHAQGFMLGRPDAPTSAVAPRAGGLARTDGDEVLTEAVVSPDGRSVTGRSELPG